MAPTDRQPSLSLGHLYLWQYGAEYIDIHHPAWSPVGFWLVIVKKNTIMGNKKKRFLLQCGMYLVLKFTGSYPCLHIRVQRKRVLYYAVLP